MWYLYGLTILAGLANAIQPGQNATLSKSLSMPITAALIILFVSTGTMLVGGLAVGKLEIPLRTAACAGPRGGGGWADA